jgi:hypothetical protein
VNRVIFSHGQLSPTALVRIVVSAGTELTIPNPIPAIPVPKLNPLSDPSGLRTNFGTFNCKALAFCQISSSVGLPIANDVHFKILHIG